MLAWEPTEAEEEEKASDFSPLLYILPPRRTKAASFLSSAFRNKGRRYYPHPLCILSRSTVDKWVSKGPSCFFVYSLNIWGYLYRILPEAHFQFSPNSCSPGKAKKVWGQFPSLGPQEPQESPQGNSTCDTQETMTWPLRRGAAETKFQQQIEKQPLPAHSLRAGLWEVGRWKRNIFTKTEALEPRPQDTGCPWPTWVGRTLPHVRPQTGLMVL